MYYPFIPSAFSPLFLKLVDRELVIPEMNPAIYFWKGKDCCKNCGLTKFPVVIPLLLWNSRNKFLKLNLLRSVYFTSFNLFQKMSVTSVNAFKHRKLQIIGKISRSMQGILEKIHFINFFNCRSSYQFDNNEFRYSVSFNLEIGPIFE